VSAVISECGAYRYLLKRTADSMLPMKPPVLFVMLNPSTADAELDDPTIRRCRGFARFWDCNGIAVANLYAYRSTDPKALWQALDPIGPENDIYLRAYARECEDVVCAWGSNAQSHRVAYVAKLMQEAGARLWCLGTTKDGSPRHPLYVRGDQPLIEWSPA
jgi:hypothetical protein